MGGFTRILVATLLALVSTTFAEEVDSVGISDEGLLDLARPMDNALYIFSDEAFSKSGMVSHVTFYATRPGDFWLGIWRPLPENAFKLMSKIQINVTSEGHHDMWLLDKDRFPVQAGDVIGIHNNKDAKKYDSNVLLSLRSSRKLKVKEASLSTAFRRWNYDNYLKTCKQMNFTHSLPSKRIALIKVHIERELVTLTKSHKYLGMEIGVVQMKVAGALKKVCDARSVKKVAEAWGNKACQMINPNYILVHAETLANPSDSSKVLEDPECPKTGKNFAECVERRDDDCELFHQTELIGCAESMEAALNPVVVNAVEYNVVHCEDDS